MFLNFGDIRVLLFGILITAVLLTLCCVKKKSIIAAALLFAFLLFLIIHLATMSSSFCIVVDFVGIIICLTVYLIIDEVEIRRKKITQVFEDRYKE